MKYRQLICLAGFMLLLSLKSAAQDEDLLKLVPKNTPQKEYVTAAFKSSRVINNHSMEFIGKGVLDVRILHRFGLVSTGAKNLFGFDQANMRFGFAYGLGKSLTVGIGRSNIDKELDGFLKYRPVWQSKGPGSIPFSVVLVSGMAVTTAPWADTARKNTFSSRLAFYNEVIIGRKFNERFSFQVSPTFVHRNLVELTSYANDTWAIGLGTRFKVSKRVAFVVDYDAIVAGRQPGTRNPLGVGFDIETGGHVFQLHFCNSTGMNEKAFLTGTTDNFWKGEVRLGFNLSRVFTIRRDKNKGGQ